MHLLLLSPLFAFDPLHIRGARALKRVVRDADVAQTMLRTLP